MRHLRVTEVALEHQVGRREAAIDIAEVLIDPALDVAGLLLVQQHRVVGARIGGAEVRRERLDIEHDRAQRGLGGGRVDGRHRDHRLAAVAYLVARQGPLVLRDRDHAIGRREVLAGDYRAHAGNRACPRRVDATDDAVRDRAAQDAADQRLAEGQVGGVARATGDLLDAIDQRRALADGAALVRGRCAPGLRAVGDVEEIGPSHRAPPAAACTDSMIFT